MTAGRPLWVEMFNHNPVSLSGGGGGGRRTRLIIKNTHCVHRLPVVLQCLGKVLLAVWVTEVLEHIHWLHTPKGKQKKKRKRRPQSLECVKFSPSKERDLFRLACNACWEILECVEWGTVVLLQLSDCIKQQGSCSEANMSEQRWVEVRECWCHMREWRSQTNDIRKSLTSCKDTFLCVCVCLFCASCLFICRFTSRVLANLCLRKRSLNLKMYSCWCFSPVLKKLKN